MCLKVEKKLVRDMKAVAIWVNKTRAGKMLGLRDLWTPRIYSGSEHLQGTIRSRAGCGQDVRSGKDDLIISTVGRRWG